MLNTYKQLDYIGVGFRFFV